MSTPDPINHPEHYLTHRSGVECITITEHLNFCLGNAIKYIWRADSKGDAINDLSKAIWYLERDITRRKALVDMEKAQLLGVIADCLEKDLVTKTDSSPNVTGNTLEYAQAANLTGNILAYAQAGDANRQNQMGLMCFHGDCMPEDKEQAVEWWKKAAEQGNYDAKMSLVNAYRNGEGVEKNQRLANYWLEHAGRQPARDAQ